MVQIHPRVHERHPELDDEDVEAAWENYCFAAVRIPGEREMRTGYDLRGRYVEMVGVLLADGAWLVYHAMTPPSKKTLKESRMHEGEVTDGVQARKWNCNHR